MLKQALGIVTLFAALLLAGSLAGAPGAPAYDDRADAAIESLLQKYWNPDRSYLNASYPDNGKLAGYWIYANAWRALTANAQRTGGRKYSGWIERLYQGQNARGWRSGYYDDENWMALALIEAYEVTPSKTSLSQAEALYAEIEEAWDETCCGPAPGGIWWDRKHTQKATASNAGPVIAGCRLYAATKDESYLRFARKVYRYWWENRVHPSTYQVTDHVNPDGTPVWWKFTYNEGLMIDAAVALSAATHERIYLAQAQQIAGFMIAHEVETTRLGPVLFDGTNRSCRGDAQQFKGPAYHALCDLYLATHRSAYYPVLKASAEAIWSLARDPALNLFAVDWAGPPQSTASLAQESAAALALSDFARVVDGARQGGDKRP